MRVGAVLCCALVALAGCGTSGTRDADATPVYGGVETVVLDDDLVNIRVAMPEARGRGDVDAYARCAAAQYTLIRGFGFARHLRTSVAETGGVWRGDAVYTISAALPAGLRTIDAEVAVADCKSQGMPTV